MNEMSVAELVELSALMGETAGIQFQYWLAITFATIVASYIAGPSLDLKLKVGIAVLYVLSAVLFAIVYGTYLARYIVFIELLQTTGVTYPATLFGLFVGPLRIVIWLIGSGLTLWFIFHNRKAKA
jgi:hypothetical protein